VKIVEANTSKRLKEKFLKGLVWGYPGILNHEISPIYHSIVNSSQEGALDGEWRVS